MKLDVINPIEFPDWDAKLLQDKDSSFFHTSAWAETLKNSYGYIPVYFASFDGGRLSFLMPLMNIESSLTGRRGVSLPFSDQCSPFSLKKDFLPIALEHAIEFAKEVRWKYIEFRDAGYFSKETIPWKVYYTHDINLMDTESKLFSSLKDSNRRNIKKALREGVSIQFDRSLGSLREFYRLNCITRRRHGLPPQPFFFFKNVYDFVLSKGYGFVISAFYSKTLIAAAVFFNFGKNAIYKYGGSNMKHQNLRPSNLILWEAIKWYRNHGYETLNFGRTEVDNQGLLQFKRLWGAIESPLTYYRYDCKNKTFIQKRPRIEFWNKLLRLTPIRMLQVFGRLFYKHIG